MLIILITLILGSYFNVALKTSTSIMNRYGERGSPCLIPLSIAHLCPLFSMQRETSHWAIDGPKPKYCKNLLDDNHSKESKAFSKSRRRIPGICSTSVFFYKTKSIINSVHSPIYRPFIKPDCFSVSVSFKIVINWLAIAEDAVL